MSQELTGERWHRLEVLFHAAQELPDEARRAFIERETSGDSDLRVQLQEMLKHADGASQRIADAISKMAAEAVACDNSRARPRHSPPLSKTIAHYRIACKIGEGGMGEVWRAIDTKLGREVAIKVLREAVAWDTDRINRFQREEQRV